MKKLTLLATAALVGVAVADAPASSVTGFYTGVNLGLANTNVKNTLQNLNVPSANAAQTYNIQSQAGKMGLQYGLFGGYNMGLGSGAVVGAELFVSGDSTKVDVYNATSGNATSVNRSFGKLTIKRTFFYGLAPRVGFMITPNVLAFVSLGIEGGKWKSIYTPDSYAASALTSGKDVGAAISNSTKNRMNFAPGVGFDAFVSKNVFIRAQYKYVFGPSITNNKDISQTEKAGVFFGDTIRNASKVTQQSFTLAVGYKF